MTVIQDMPSRRSTDRTLAPVLRAAHESWIRESNEFLLPLTVRQTPFWDRWTAVRYLADQFLGQYRRERALVDELRPLLPPAIGDRLVEQGQRIGRLQEALDQLGRRRGTGPTAKVISRGLLYSVRDWCAEIEAAAGGISRGGLQEDGRRLVADLELHAEIRMTIASS